MGAAGLAFGAGERDARACGGCFGPPSDNTIVSYHRMALSISSRETTLYDQIRYSGSPSSFAWVLPIHGTVKVGLSADAVFTLLDQNTKTVFEPPPQNCPAPPYCPTRSTHGGAASDSVPGTAADGGVATNGGVSVLAEDTVGPYETVQLASTSPTALNDWLTQHGYSIPADIQPLIASYVNEGFDFLALKLVPGANVQSMKPVRVTMPGANPSLPLRMVAAGSGTNVGVTLWVIGDGRWEPQSFPWFAIKADEVTWTWKTYRDDSDARRAAHIAELGPSAWEIESSTQLGAYLITSALDSYAKASMPPQVALPDGGVGPLRIYDPVLDAHGNVIESASQVEQDDMEALFQGRTAPRVTRMRSNLPRASLATDLALQAGDQSLLPNVRQITKEADEPLCPVYDGCTYVDEEPRSMAHEKAADSCPNGTTPASPQSGAPYNAAAGQFCGSTLSGGGGCTLQASSPRALGGAGLAGLAALGALLGVRRRRAGARRD